VILSGDQLYRMDFRKILQQHLESYADITIATSPVTRGEATSLGILQVNEENGSCVLWKSRRTKACWMS